MFSFFPFEVLSRIGAQIISHVYFLPKGMEMSCVGVFSVSLLKFNEFQANQLTLYFVKRRYWIITTRIFVANAFVVQGASAGGWFADRCTPQRLFLMLLLLSLNSSVVFFFRRIVWWSHLMALVKDTPQCVSASWPIKFCFFSFYFIEKDLKSMAQSTYKSTYKETGCPCKCWSPDVCSAIRL